MEELKTKEEEAVNEAPAAPVEEPITYPALLTVAPSPHQKTRTHVPHMMIDVLIALLPAYIFGVIWFGLSALAIGVISVLGCVLAELVFEKIMRRPVTVRDGSAAVTGLLIAMNLPVTIVNLAKPDPVAILQGVFMILLADIFAIVLVKGLFGGLGKNIVNPALAARVFLFMSFPAAMSSYACPAGWLGADAATGATPLSELKESGALADLDLLDMFIGKTGGCIGEVSAVLLLLGGIYLIARRVISWRIPVAYLGTVALVALIFPRLGGLEAVPFELLSGGLMLGAFFMATDYVTSPVTPVGRLIFGALCGLLTVFIRYFGAYPEGVSFAILISNLLVYYIDRFTKPTPFGGGKKKA